MKFLITYTVITCLLMFSVLPLANYNGQYKFLLMFIWFIGLWFIITKPYRHQPQFNLSKYEAIDALHAGYKVTHIKFSSTEYIVFNENAGCYYSSNGYVSTPEEFWVSRQDKKWNTGWKLFE